MKSKSINIIIGIILVSVIAFAIFQSSAAGRSALVAKGEPIYMPSWTTVACEQTRLECYPGPCSSVNPPMEQVPSAGKWYWCGPKPADSMNVGLADADYYDGCQFEITTKAFIEPSIKKCDFNGQNCVSIDALWKWSSNSYRGTINGGQKLFINPIGGNVTARMQAAIYGITIKGATVNPVYRDRCNLATVLMAGDLSLLKADPNYAKIINAGEISPGNYPISFINTYLPALYNQNTFNKDGDTWYISRLATQTEGSSVCKVVQTTNGLFIVSDECRLDDEIQCYPNIANCDAFGRYIINPDGQEKACEPGTLIGTSSTRIPVNTEEACKIVCDTYGKQIQTDCIKIPKCTGGLILNQNYECVESTSLTSQDKCELKGGTYKIVYNAKGQVTSEDCTMPKPLNTNLILIVAGVILIIAVLVIKPWKKGGK